MLIVGCLHLIVVCMLCFWFDCLLNCGFVCWLFDLFWLVALVCVVFIVTFVVDVLLCFLFCFTDWCCF